MAPSRQREVVHRIDVGPLACPEAEVVQADTSLHEALAAYAASRRRDAERGATADAVEELVDVEHRLQAEERQQLAVESARRGEVAHGERRRAPCR